MPTLSWNEIKARALKFSRDWNDPRLHREAREKQTFWNEFFDIFGIRRRSVAAFEEPLKNIRGKYGFLDLFWPGVVLVEHKTAGASLDKAESQAFEYVRDLTRANRHQDVPRYVVVSDFARFGIYDLEPEDGAKESYSEIQLKDLHEHIREFAFLAGGKPQKINPEDPANFEATALLAGLHDSMKEAGYTQPDLEQFLVRVLFCLFAEDTGIFEPLAFTNFLRSTKEDGSDLGEKLDHLFRSVLNKPESARSKNLNEDLAAFPYVNGALFAQTLDHAEFSSKQRDQLLKCANFQWAKISPAVFGSLFQDILDKPARRQIGAHYTNERDILKVLRARFLDELEKELALIKADRSTRRNARLEEFQKKLRSIRVLDPACGCGNFLILAYRELRRLEQELLVELHKNQRQLLMGIRDICKVDVDQFYGIEKEEWPCRIAEVGLWLADHQANRLLAQEFGFPFMRIPLRAAPTIRHGNALSMDWGAIVPPSENVYVIGNPPFVGKKEQTREQKKDVVRIWGDTEGAGELDYVTCWYRRAAEYMAGTRACAAFVSTNSICQGEHVAPLWGHLLGRGFRIHFAHTTFMWESEARGKAHVHVVIVGFGAFDAANKQIYEYAHLKGEPTAHVAKNINPYLADAPDVIARSRRKPVNGGPAVRYGSMMIDKPRRTKDDDDDKYDRGLIIGGDDARRLFLAESKKLDPYIKRCTGGVEYINGQTKWCLWLVDAPPEVIRSSRLVKERVEGVRKFRLSSGREQTQRLAATPSLFGERRQPTTKYLLIPKVSSESRRYVPIGFVEPDVIATGSAIILPDATNYHFGILSSSMHNAWMRYVGGRMKSDYQYSSEVVYNNFPWPTPSDKQTAAVEEAAAEVLAARKAHSGSTLAALYDQNAMPADLARAHERLDLAVDKCYRGARFRSDHERVEHLFTMYAALLELETNPGAKRRRSSRAPA